MLGKVLQVKQLISHFSINDITMANKRLLHKLDNSNYTAMLG